MVLIRLTAENFKKLKLINLEPKGNLVEITGPNSAGKSSACEALWGLLRMSDLKLKEPVRRGADKGVLKGYFGSTLGAPIELEVIRRFNNAGTIDLTVRNANGSKVAGGPQTIIDTFLSSLSFEPKRFLEQKPQDQFDTLRKLVKLEVDIDALDRQNEIDFDKRTMVNREVDRLKALLDSKQRNYPKQLPSEEIDLGAITVQMQQAVDANADIATEKERRHRLAEKARGLRESAEEFRTQATQARQRERGRLQQAAIDATAEIGRVSDQIFELEAKIDALRKRKAELNSTVKANAEGAKTGKLQEPQEAVEALKLAEAKETEAKLIEKRLADSPEFPAPIDMGGFQSKIQEAQSTNELVRQKKETDQISADLRVVREKSEAFTSAMKDRDATKLNAISAAQMPVEGLGFGKGEVLYNNFPLSQAGTAEQWKVAISICIALQPKLRAILVKDGSNLDKKTKATILEMAKKHDYYVFLEEVDETGKVGFVMEDGEIVAVN